jgi:hypothetical protein
MLSRAQLSTTDLRQAERYSVSYDTRGERREGNEVRLRLTNMSARGCLASCATHLQWGDQMSIRRPAVGWLEMFCLWVGRERAGFQSERIIRQVDFGRMLEALRTSPRDDRAAVKQDKRAA